jgi:flagellar biosynthesis GTPase FlhF
MPERRSYRAESLEEALQLVSDELGPDAIVVTQREGVVGGIGGFFGKRCVELEVEAAPPAIATAKTAEDTWFDGWDDTGVDWPAAVPVAVRPARSIIDAYDSTELARPQEPILTEPVLTEPILTVASEPEPEAVDDDHGTLVQTIFEQASPFADELTAALTDLAIAAERERITFVEPEPEPEPVVEAAPLVEEVSDTEVSDTLEEPSAELVVIEPEPENLPEPRVAHFDPGSIERRLIRSGLTERVAREVVSEAANELRIFDPLTPFEDHVRQALARRIKVSRDTRKSKKQRRVIALVGPPGAGKTLAAARMLHAHRACANREVAGLTLAPVRDALALADQTRSLQVEITSATEERGLRSELDRLEPVDLLVVDTPGIDPSDQERLGALGYLLELVGVDETHLLVPASYGPERVRTLVEAFAPAVGADRMMITHLDGRGNGAGVVAAAVTARLPISFTAVGSSWGLRPANPDDLAGLVVS